MTRPRKRKGRALEARFADYELHGESFDYGARCIVRDALRGAP